jgi:hypothetical protein
MSDKAGTKTLHRPKAKICQTLIPWVPQERHMVCTFSQEGRRGKKKKKKGEEWGDLLARG